MGSLGNTNPWAPYDSFKDCSQGICSVYCPQWCYFILPPPPPSDDDEGSDGSNTAFSPLIIAIIGILASAFLLVSYYTIITKYCRRRRSGSNNSNAESNRDEAPQDQWQVVTTGLDETTIKAITVCKFKKGEGLVEGTECAVCLSDFQEGESLRLLPKCSHAFHLPCIDTWLKSHSNCPLCRANVLVPSLPPPLASPPTTANFNINALHFQRQNDLILVVDGHRERAEVVVSLVCCDVSPNSEFSGNGNGNEQERFKEFRRSISLGAFSRQHVAVSSDKTSDDNEELQGIGSSKGEESMKRCVSTGRYTFSRQNRGKDSVVLC